MKRTAIIIGIALCAYINAGAQSPPVSLVSSLDSLVNSALPTNVFNPGLVVSVYVPGQWEWSGATGKAISGFTSGYPNVDAQPNNPFRIGSITKMFMATAILMLEEDALLSVEDDIALYLRASLVNDTIASSAPVKIRHLLNHTSGIGNLADNDSCRMAAMADLTRTFTLEEAIFCGAGQGEYFPPDFAWGYSNTNYALLAMIIKNITGVSAADYIQSNIIDVLNLDDTGVPITDELQGPHMGCYWELPPMIDLTIVDATLYHGWADIAASPEDLNKFFHALRSETLINATSLAKMETIAGVAWDYGYGLEYYDIGGDLYYGHSGDVGNTSGLFFSDISTATFPDGYYVAYNYTYEGVAPYNVLDKPLHDLMQDFVPGPGDTGTTPVTTEQLAGAFNLSVYPNPAEDYVIIQADQPLTTDVVIALKDISGRIVPSVSYTVDAYKISVSLAGLNPGIYFIALSGEMGFWQEKLIIHHN